MRFQWLARSSAILALAGGALFPLASSGAPAAAQATGPTVVVGSGEPGYAVNLFGPSEVTVPVGGTVNFKAGWLEPHTVTFRGANKPVPPPDDPTAAVPTHPGQVVSYNGSEYVNSGFIASGGVFGENNSFALKFSKEGAFPFSCIIHPGMDGVVKVVAPGVNVSSQASLDAATTKIFGDALTALKAEAAKVAQKPFTKSANADGSSTWRVSTVGALVGPSDVQQFIPAAMNVQEGDTVVWESSITTPHTVTFLGGADLGKIIAEGPPDILANEKIFLPTQAPATGYTGNGYINSGVIGTGFPSGLTYSVKFGKAGAYPFLCILHVEQGMGGVVNVAAKTQATPASTAVAPAPPKTGTAGLSGGESGAPFFGLMLAGLGVALLVGVRVATGRSR